jgi:hypothetical protein
VAEIRGTVSSLSGDPVAGVLVMGADLNYAETDAEGRYKVSRPEMALFFWCPGFLPEVRLIPTSGRDVDVILQPVAVMRASA